MIRSTHKLLVWQVIDKNTAPIKSEHGSAAPTLRKQPFGLIDDWDRTALE